MTICGSDCCKTCKRFSECGGCESCGGHPFGGTCIAADTITKEGKDAYERLKNDLIREINALHISGLGVDDLNLLNGFYVNLAYPLPNGTEARFLNDSDIYFGNQIERKGRERCYGVVACREFILVCEYGRYGTDPVLIEYRRR